MTMRVAGMIAAAGVLAATLGGCAQRRIVVTSEPSGATVYVNDVEIGRTPVSAAFTYYGVYDVRLRKDGYEPISTSARAETPLYEFAGPDLVTEAIPGGVLTKVIWHFTMQPIGEVGNRKAFEQGLLERAGELRKSAGDAK